MKLHRLGLLLLLFAGPALAAATTPVIKNEYMVSYKKAGKFEDVVEAVRLSITEQGLVVNNVSHIGKMLARTGKDLGAGKSIYLHAQALEFCSATVSRATMEADPHNIVFCPYIIAVYELSEEPGQIYLSYRRPEIVGDAASRKSLRAVETLVDGIVQEALSW